MRLWLPIVCLVIPHLLAGGQRQMALTFDDLPWKDGRVQAGEVVRMNDELLKTLRQQGVRVVGFVNEDKISHRGECALRRNILRQWLDAGHELGNHGAAHGKLSQETLPEFYADVVRGEKTVNELLLEKGQPTMRFFRYPYLDLGNHAQRKPARRFLLKRGYTVAGITIDSRDWEYNMPFCQAKQAGNHARMDQIRRGFLRFLDQQLGEMDDVGGHEKEILLLHACTITAESLEEIFAKIRQRGYDFCTLDEALGLASGGNPQPCARKIRTTHRRCHR